MTIQIKDSDGTVRLSGDLLAAGGATGDVLTQQADGTYAPEVGGGALPDPITTVVNIEADTTTAGPQTPFIIQDDTEPGPAYLASNLNGDGAGNVDSAVSVAALGTGSAAILGTDITKDGYFQWYTAYGWSHQPRSDDADSAQSFVLYDKNGDELIEGRAGGLLGFFNKAPAGQQNVPLTMPSVQDVINALVALGLVEQSDP